mmetsp:Transcript_18978/g.39702  ORF Transcript_18978/g.39702 Transcript_18978/m.39702 type:complete len:674 (+) Transcript_18978:418-2439(+)
MHFRSNYILHRASTTRRSPLLRSPPHASLQLQQQHRHFSRSNFKFKATTITTIPSKYLTNGGTIEGVWIFHRHGDRAPNRFLGSDSYLERESDHWSSRIPSREGGGAGPYLKDSFLRGSGSGVDDTTAYKALSYFFPPSIHPSQNNGMFLDVDREPFGFLTWRGMDQMRGVGKRMRKRYERFGYRIANNYRDGDSNDASMTTKEDCYFFLDHWDVKAYSTNYLRTVMSVQCFLDGLISTPKVDEKVDVNNTTVTDDNCNVLLLGDDATKSKNVTALYAGGGLPRYYKDYYRDVAKYEQLMHQDHSTLTNYREMEHLASSSPSRSTEIKVQVRDKVLDTLNAFDRFPQMMNGLVRDVIATERFQRIDYAAKPLAEKLSYYLQGLQGAPQAFGGTPSGINWIHANDHFVCRRAHSIPLTAFSDYEGKQNEREVEQILAQMANPVLAHLSWRFREWYRCPRLLAAIAAPPLKEVWRNMMEIVEQSGCLGSGRGRGGDGKKRPFHIYSCHDVTLLSLLYGIGADFLVSGEDCGGKQLREEEAHLNIDDVGTVRDGAQQRESWRWWPAYSSTIAFELVRVEDADAEGVDGYVIRVILNGDTVRIIPRLEMDDEGILREQSVCSRKRFGELMKGGGCEMLRLSGFSQIIQVMEQSGKRNTSPSVEDVEPKYVEERRWQG